MITIPSTTASQPVIGINQGASLRIIMGNPINPQVKKVRSIRNSATGVPEYSALGSEKSMISGTAPINNGSRMRYLVSILARILLIFFSIFSLRNP
jgi:hypothetical protein